MKVNRTNVKDISGKELEIKFIGDFHLGARELDLKLLKEDIEYIKKRKNIKVVVMGDVLDAGLPDSVGAGSLDNNMTPEEQYELALELLLPIKNKISSVLIGNHCLRIYNETSINLMKNLARELGSIYLGHSGFEYVRFGNNTYIIYATHGSAGATTVAGKIGSCMKLSNFIDADVYAMAHVHDKAFYESETISVSLKDKGLQKKKKVFLLTGHYLQYGGYAQQKQYAPGKSGSTSIFLSADRWDIRVKI